jgi:pectin methylesterase-like acyl-CoA thioesterase
MAHRVSSAIPLQAAPRRSLCIATHTLFATALLAAVLPSVLHAQTPTLLPGTISAIAGSAPAATTVGSPCATNSPFTAADTLGDGCPAINAVFQNTETSMAVDPAGNVYLSNNSSNQIVRRIDARTGLISKFAGYAASQCASGVGTTIYGTKVNQTDKTGDNCPVSSSYGFNGPVSLGVDPYGNLLIGSTGDLNLHLVCNALSPACSSAAVGENLMITAAGCTVSATGYGTAVTGVTPGTAGDGHIAVQTGVSSCASTAGGIGSRIYGVVGDKWDNIYFADATNGRFRVVAGAPSIVVNGITLTNPLYATLQTSTTAPNNYTTVTQGFIYPIAGGGTVCGGSSDAGGDGCPFTQTIVATSSSGALLQGIAVDTEGDFIFADGLGRLRVIYEGGTIIRGALTAQGITNPQLGYSYALIAGTTGAINYNSGNPGIVLGKNAALQSGAIQTLTVDPAGNIVIGDQIQVLFYDIATGYVRRLATSYGYAAPGCSTETDTFGDGCALTQSTYGATSKALYVSEDALGNLYLLDLTNHLIRRVSALTLPTTAVNGSLTSTLTVHAPVAGSSVAITAATGSDFTVGTPTCTTNSSSDGSVDCTTALTYAPTKVALRNDAIAVATTVGSNTLTQNLGLNALGTGTALVFDTTGTQNTTTLAGTLTGITAIAMDGAGNEYVISAQGISKVTATGAVVNISSAPASYIAVDAVGSVYTTAGNTTVINKYTYSAATGTYTSSIITTPKLNLCTTTVSSITCALTQVYTGPLSVDAEGILYLVDQTNLQAVKFGVNGSPYGNQPGLLGAQLTQTKLTAPTAMAQDTFGNLLILDGTTILEVPAAGYPVLTTSPTANLAVKLTTALSAPTAIAVDQAENIYIADTVSGVNTIKVQTASNFAQTATNYQYTLPNVTGTALAVNGAGNLFLTTATTAGITQVLRNAQTFAFGTNITIADTGVLLNAAGTNATGFKQTDTTTDFTESTPATPLAPGASTCSITSTVLLAGGVCNVAFTFTPTANGNGDTPNTITLLPSASTQGSVFLDGTKSGSTATTSTVITGNTTGLIYSSASTGPETTFTVTVTESPAAVPTGTVAVSIDNGTAVNYTLSQLNSSSSTATVPVSGLSTTMTHTIAASYAASSGIAGSSSGTTSFTIAPNTTSTTWSPSGTTIQYSAALGTALFNASTTSSAFTGSVPGVYVYTATPTAGGTAQNIHSASYLAIGTYTLGVTFVPTDSADLQQSTASGGTLTITKASTTAGLGATQNLVASDGTGNYTSIQTAVNALPSGGSIYIKPGTYTGDITVVQPSIALRGLGGDPTKVILTHPGGSFGGSGNTGVYQYAGEFTSAQNNGFQLPSGSSLFTGDEGSATLVVAKGINTALSTAQQTPNSFYAENLSLINSYNTDTTTTTTYVSGGNCTAGNATAYSYQYLYNNGTQCASQALAIWTTSDLSIMNNVISTSQQDTVYTASPGSGSNGYVPTRQYWFRGKISGNVDFIFGDAAAVFDSTSIYTTWHGNTATGTETIHAQNQAQQTGSGTAYLSGYILNNAVLTSQSSGMTALYFGRPYGTYSTWVMLNTFVDQVNALGYTTGLGPTLTNSTFLEYNDIPYTDPATNAADLNGIPYLGTGGSTGQGVTGTREALSTNPGTPSASLNPPVSLTQALAQAYYPTNFLSQAVSSVLSSTTNWNPTAALATQVNSFVPSGTSATIAYGQSITLLMRPLTPGLGAIVPTTYSASSPTPVTFTVPTGTYSLSDTVNGSTSVIASGSLDATGEAYYLSATTAALAPGVHSLKWTYSGDTNFAGSTSSAYTLTINAPTASTTTAVSANPSPATYGQSPVVTVTVLSAGNPVTSGTVSITVDGTAYGTAQALNGSGQTSFTVTNLAVASHPIVATYSGSTGTSNSYSSSTGNFSLIVQQAPLTVTSLCANRVFDTANVCSASVSGYKYSDTVATVFTSTPTGTTSALPKSPAGSYPDTPVATLSTFGTTNYTLTLTGGSFTISGGTPQNIIFPALANFASGGSYQLTAYTTSGLPVAYSVTSGNATVSGTTLTVTAPGPVTIKAFTNADPTGNYTLATAVSRSFTAQ